MANNKNSKNVNSKKNVGQSTDILKNAQNNQSLNEILNRPGAGRGYGNTGKTSSPQTEAPKTVGGVSFGSGGFVPPTGAGKTSPRPLGTQAGQTPQSPLSTQAGQTPQSPSGSPFFSASRSPLGSGGASGMFGASSGAGQTPQAQTGAEQTPPPGAPGSALSLLQSLRQGAATPEKTASTALPTYKTKKELKQELRRQKQDRALREKMSLKPTPTAGAAGLFGAGGVSGIAGQPPQTPPLPQAPSSVNTTLSASDFFKQLEQLNQINVSTSTNLDALSDEEYVDEKEQQILEQLERLQKGQDEKEKKKRRGAWFWIFIVVLLVLLLSVVGYIIYNNFVPRDYEYVRISVEMQNPEDLFYDVGLNGERIPVAVNPGDSFDLTIIARNSRNILGDTDAPVWNSILVRFKIWVIIDGEEMLNFIDVSPNSHAWMRYDREKEDEYKDEYGFPIVDRDDGYYYLMGMLQPNQEIVLINSITFNLHAITEEYGGKTAELRVQVEVLEDAIGIATYWQTAPREWINYLQEAGYVS